MIQLTNATLLANNSPVSVVPNSVKFTEGKGEQTLRAASSGDGATEHVYAENVESAFSKLMFSLHSTPENIELALSWKVNRNQNFFTIAGKTPDGKEVTRSFRQAAVVNDYEVPIASEGDIELEIHSKSAI